PRPPLRGLENVQSQETPPGSLESGQSERRSCVSLSRAYERLEFNPVTGVAIAVAYWRRRSPGRKRGRPGGTTAPCHGRPYEGWKMSKVRRPLRSPCGLWRVREGRFGVALAIDRRPLRVRRPVAG